MPRNMLTDGANTYVYNAESEITSAGGVTNWYDGDGNRVAKGPGGYFWYGAGSEVLTETDPAGNANSDYIYFGGKRVAWRRYGPSSTLYYEADMLGSARTMVIAGQTTPYYDADYYPYGGERAILDPTSNMHYKFEGKMRDPETGNDDFGARFYSSRIGRWLSADWSSVPVPVPYANLANPQTLNLYAMVADNPESFADLDGHCMIDFDCVWSVWSFGARQVQGGNNKTNASTATSANNQANSGATAQSSQQTGVQQAQQSANDHTKPPPANPGGAPKPTVQPGPAPTDPATGKELPPPIPLPADVNGNPTKWKPIPGSGPIPGSRWIPDGKVPSPDGKGGKPHVV